MRKSFSASCLYLTLGSLILTWWFLAFKDKGYPPSNLDQETSLHNSLAIPLNTLFASLSDFRRDELRQALAGDQDLMIHLISNWDADARCLSEQGVVGIQRLPFETYLKAHLLFYLTKQLTPEERFRLNCQIRHPEIRDDNGTLIDALHQEGRFLPYTYVAASFLLAIASPQEIGAIPRGMRSLPQIYSPALLKQIPTDSDCYAGEKLFLFNPDLAFVAPYSHPPTIAVLRNQGVKLCTLKNIDTLESIQKTLLKTGHLTNHSLEANLLQIFMDACFLSLDNRLRALHQLVHPPENQKNVLFLYYHQHYMIPTTRCLTGQLIERALEQHPGLSCPISFNHHEWRVPFDQEKIIQSKPDCLIICTPHGLGFKKQLETKIAFIDLPAFREKNIFFVDELIQESPTQYLTLAYFDLVNALASIYTETTSKFGFRLRQSRAIESS